MSIGCVVAHRYDLTAATAAEMESLGERLASRILLFHLIFVRGPLGAGKTTWVRGLLRGLGHQGPVKSPTFTLVEPYSLTGREFYHFDFYRVEDPEELEFVGLRDYIQGNNLCVVEWPERGARILPQPDIDVIIQPGDTGRSVQLVAYCEYSESPFDGLT